MKGGSHLQYSRVGNSFMPRYGVPVEKPSGFRSPCAAFLPCLWHATIVVVDC